MTDPLVRLRNVSKSYGADARRFVALDAISLDISAGECVAVVGKSGSGKTTLINLLTGIDTPTSGTIEIGPHAIHRLSQEGLAAWRGRNVGIVFQFFQLLPTLTIAENVMLPMDFCNVHPRRDRRARALALLERLEIAEQADKVPADLSGGQQQRAAIARALATDPPLIVADEPTGNLDSVTSDVVLAFLAGLAEDGKTVITVSHERELDRYFTRTISLRDGVVTEDTGACVAALT
ncbi:MAG: ABC transporter ATP-binding protein [Gemmatimonadaceae bacterium]|nr:ABC transporter ATP-binding protein [Gemmatimonadaceae bacterium]